MNKDLRDYVILDGVYFKEEQILKMASNAGSFAVAEHYLCAYLAHSLLYGKKDNIVRVNEVRDIYNVPAIPLPDEIYAPRDEYGRSRIDSIEIKGRKYYGQMAPNKQKKILTSCLKLLKAQTELFGHKNDWLSVMLVVRDRLDGSINQNNFADFARSITPEDWPEGLRISDHTPKNFSRLLAAEDRMEAYYDMNNNPQAHLCDKLWDIIIQSILTEIP